MHRIIRTSGDLEALARSLEHAPRPFTITMRPGEHRSTPQNSLQWELAAAVSAETGDEKDDVQRRWKLVHGLPILAASDPVLADTLERMLAELSYAQRLKAMDLLHVSRVMTSAQMTDYLSAIERECAEMGIT